MDRAGCEDGIGLMQPAGVRKERLLRFYNIIMSGWLLKGSHFFVKGKDGCSTNVEIDVSQIKY